MQNDQHGGVRPANLRHVQLSTCTKSAWVQRVAERPQPHNTTSAHSPLSSWVAHALLLATTTCLWATTCTCKGKHSATNHPCRQPSMCMCMTAQRTRDRLAKEPEPCALSQMLLLESTNTLSGTQRTHRCHTIVFLGQGLVRPQAAAGNTRTHLPHNRARGYPSRGSCKPA